MNNLSITTVDFLRHGECEGGHCYRGSLDVPLTDRGYQQMQRSLAVAECLPDAEWELIVSSPLLRCKTIADDISRQKNIPLRVEPLLKEIHFGDWEGQLVDTVWQNQREQVDAWGRDPINNSTPNGEAFDQFATRVLQAWDGILQQYEGQKILLITHGGVMRVLLTHVLGMSLSDVSRLDVPYACLSRIAITHAPEKNYDQLIHHNIAQ